jgi:Tfp pilus assembly protein FimT
LTLIELIVVMTMLATVLAVAAPTLSRFFAGRVLENEARRMLALTRYARSEAISRSVLMELWFHPESGTYGLDPQAGYEFDDRKPVEFILADGLVFEVDGKAVDEQGKVKILFWPDGSIDGESVEYVRIREDEESAVEIAQADYGLGYLIQSAELGS